MRLNHALEACIVLVAYGYIYLAPFTKVEESFSLHFVHDMLSSFSGKNLTAIISLDKVSTSTTAAVLRPCRALTRSSFVFLIHHQFDHVAFPGAVPRSFLGPLVLSVATWPFLWLGSQCNLWHNTHSVQILGESSRVLQSRLIPKKHDADRSMVLLRCSSSARAGFVIVGVAHILLPSRQGLVWPSGGSAQHAVHLVAVSFALLLGSHVTQHDCLPSRYATPLPRLLFNLILTSVLLLFQSKLSWPCSSLPGHHERRKEKDRMSSCSKDSPS